MIFLAVRYTIDIGIKGCTIVPNTHRISLRNTQFHFRAPFFLQKIFVRKSIAFLATFMLLINSLLPYFAYGIQPTIAHADAPPALSVTFDMTSNDLQLSVNTASKVEYTVSYTRTSDTVYQIEGVQGSGADASGTYIERVYTWGLVRRPSVSGMTSNEPL